MKNKNQSAQQLAKDFLDSGINLPFLPSTGPQLLAISRQPVESIDVDKLVELIQVDPGLATKILQLANSAYFGTYQNIVGLKQAVMHIGLTETVNSVTMLFFKEVLPKFPDLEGGFSDKNYWNHSLACAIANKMLSHPQISTNIMPGELYIAGLLHGIGNLILALHKPEELLQCIQVSNEFSISLRDAQLDIMGTTDAFIASEILKNWQFPEKICNAVKYYQFPAEAENKHREFAALTEFAYFIANTSDTANMIDDYNIDLKQTWMVQHSNTILTDQNSRESFTDRMYDEIKKKTSAMGAIDGENSEEEQEEVEVSPKKQKQKQSMLEKVMSFFS